MLAGNFKLSTCSYLSCNRSVLCALSQLLEDFAADSRRTVCQMAESRRGSPVLRRIASALCTMCCRLEARLLRCRSSTSTPATQARAGNPGSTHCITANRLAAAQSEHPALRAALFSSATAVFDSLPTSPTSAVTCCTSTGADGCSPTDFWSS
jgi:hypothetical protein